RGEMDVLWSSGGNFLATLPDPNSVRSALARTSLRVHQNILVSPQMLIEGDEVLLLPAMTRYEQPGGGTETTTERRVVLSPEIPGPRPGEARAEWDIFAEVGRRARPEAAPGLGLRSAAKIRAETAGVVAAYAGFERGGTSCRSAPGTCRCSGRRPTRSSPRAGATRSRAFPTTTRWSRSRAGEPALGDPSRGRGFAPVWSAEDRRAARWRAAFSPAAPRAHRRMRRHRDRACTRRSRVGPSGRGRQSVIRTRPGRVRRTPRGCAGGARTRSA